MSLSPQRLGKSWQVFADAVMEHRLTQSGDAALARHVGNLALRSDRSGIRPELELTSLGAFVNGAIAGMIAYERATELASVPPREPMMAWVERPLARCKKVAFARDCAVWRRLIELPSRIALEPKMTPAMLVLMDNPEDPFISGTWRSVE